MHPLRNYLNCSILHLQMMTSTQSARSYTVRTIAKKPQTMTLSVSVNQATHSMVTTSLVLVRTLFLFDLLFSANDYLLFRETMFILAVLYE